MDRLIPPVSTQRLEYVVHYYDTETGIVPRWVSLCHDDSAVSQEVARLMKQKYKKIYTEVRVKR